MNSLSEAPRLVHVWLGSFAPDYVSVRRVGQTTRDGGIQSTSEGEESLDRLLPGHERPINWVAVAGNELGSISIRSRNQDGRNIEYIRGQACCNKLLHSISCRHKDFAAHMAALLRRRQLIFEVYGGRSCFDHALHQFEGIEYASKSSFRVRHDRQHPVDRVRALTMGNLVSTQQRTVQSPHHAWNTIRRVQALVGIHLSGQISVSRHLRTAQVDRLQPRLSHLHRLVSGECAKCRDVSLLVQKAPELLRTCAGKRVLDSYCPAQSIHVFHRVRAYDSAPSGRIPIVGCVSLAHVVLLRCIWRVRCYLLCE